MLKFFRLVVFNAFFFWKIGKIQKKSIVRQLPPFSRVSLWALVSPPYPPLSPTLPLRYLNRTPRIGPLNYRVQCLHKRPFYYYIYKYAGYIFFFCVNLAIWSYEEIGTIFQMRLVEEVEESNPDVVNHDSFPYKMSSQLNRDPYPLIQ